MALNSFDRRFELEQCDVRIHELNRDFKGSFMAAFEPLNQGVRVTFDAEARRLAEKAAKRRNDYAHQNAREMPPTSACHRRDDALS